MYKVNYDMSKNRIYAELGGFLKDEELKDYKSELIKAVDQAKPNFTALFDVRSLKPLPEECNQILEDAKSYAVNNGLKKSAAVLNSVVLKLQGTRKFKNMAKDKPEEYFSTTEEAESFLNK